MGSIVLASTNAACTHPNLTTRGQTGGNWTTTHPVKQSNSSGTQTCYVTNWAEELYAYCPDCYLSSYIDTIYHVVHSICGISY